MRRYDAVHALRRNDLQCGAEDPPIVLVKADPVRVQDGVDDAVIESISPGTTEAGERAEEMTRFTASDLNSSEYVGREDMGTDGPYPRLYWTVTLKQ